MRRWAAGTTGVPQRLYVDLLRLTQERAAALDELAPRLREAAPELFGVVVIDAAEP
ncbi:MAG TPA: hypothetical protein VNU71_13450 [Burkholderiaceae bacterium]|nr:hypothetical protein [Burkholderiaceae bacterium]